MDMELLIQLKHKKKKNHNGAEETIWEGYRGIVFIQEWSWETSSSGKCKIEKVS